MFRPGPPLHPPARRAPARFDPSLRHAEPVSRPIDAKPGKGVFRPGPPIVVHRVIDAEQQAAELCGFRYATASERVPMCRGNHRAWLCAHGCGAWMYSEAAGVGLHQKECRSFDVLSVTSH